MIPRVQTAFKQISVVAPLQGYQGSHGTGISISKGNFGFEKSRILKKLGILG